MTAGAAVALDALMSSIQADLDLAETEMQRMLASTTEPVRSLLEHISSFRGKQLRPALVLVAGKMFGDLGRDHHRVAAIVESIHVATLVHDDILDESTMRRGVETVNKKVGCETAVLLGDYLFATAFKEAALLESRFPACDLSEVVAVVCTGEIQQVHNRNNLDLSEETYFEIIERKTAALYAGALRNGAHLSGASEEQAAALARFGTKFGTAFQIVDDILDLMGDEARVGKSLGTDLDKAKMTLPLLRLRDQASRADRTKLEDAIRSHAADARTRIRPLLVEYGGLDSAQATADALVHDAQSELESLPDVPERNLLRQAAKYVVSRDR
ncbi:MAG: polyprenyl synthetase family protein [Planctomycetota bacterium]|nr:polyprenyl synthetase family protein [Planctomycetota bacterium]